MDKKRQDSFRVMLTEAVIKLCQMEAVYTEELRIEGTVCVVSDHTSVVIAHFAECIGDTQLLDKDSNDSSLCLFEQHIVDGLSIDHTELMLPEVKLERVPSDDEIITTFDGVDVDDSLSLVDGCFQGTEIALNANNSSTVIGVQQSTSGQYQCPLCDKMCRSECTLQRHLNTHCGHLAFNCHYCHVSFISATALQTHLRTQHGEPSNSQLNKTRKQQYGRHHHKVSLKTEQDRNVEHSQANSMHMPNEEMTQADDADSLAFLEKCEQRDYENMTDDAQLLMNDTNVAEDQAVQLAKTGMYSTRKTRCLDKDENAGKATVMQYFEKVHVETLRGLCQYKCRLCQKMFKLRTSLYEHINSHTGKRRYACNQCGYRFVHHSSLHNHMHNKHMAASQGPGTLRYLCKGCDRQFKFRSQLQRHLRSNPNHRTKVLDE